MTNVSNLPVDVDFDLDAEERDPSEIKPPFRTNVGGRVITMTDPAEIDWQDLMEIGDPAMFLRYAMSKEDREHVAGLRIPGWKLGLLVEKYQKHYGLDEQLAKARRQGRLA